MALSEEDCLTTTRLVEVQAAIAAALEAAVVHTAKELDATKKMIERVEEDFAAIPNHLIGAWLTAHRRWLAGWRRTGESSRISR